MSSPGTGRNPGPVDRRVPVAVSAPDPISHEGAVSQLRRHPEIELREESGPGTVALLVEDALDEAALTRLRRIVRSEGARAVLVVGAMRENELLDVVECGVGAIVWRHEATADRLVQAVLAASRGDGDLPADLLGRLIHQVGSLHRGAAGRTGTPSGSRPARWTSCAWSPRASTPVRSRASCPTPNGPSRTSCTDSPHASTCAIARTPWHLPFGKATSDRPGNRRRPDVPAGAGRSARRPSPVPLLPGWPPGGRSTVDDGPGGNGRAGRAGAQA